MTSPQHLAARVRIGRSIGEFDHAALDELVRLAEEADTLRRDPFVGVHSWRELVEGVSNYEEPTPLETQLAAALEEAAGRAEVAEAEADTLRAQVDGKNLHNFALRARAEAAEAEANKLRVALRAVRMATDARVMQALAREALVAAGGGAHSE